MFSFLKKKTPTVQAKIITYQEDYNDIKPLSDYFHNETGITFDSQISILKSKVTSFCKQRGIYSFSKLLGEIKTNTHLKQELIDYLTTNETYFYREFKQIEELVNLVKESHGSVDILCAPSATGEEVYSIAIALLEAGVSSSSFHILGIDINSDAISKAQNAVYGERNIRNLTAEIISKYFEMYDSKYVVKQSLKSLVSFQVTNIFDSSFKNIGKFNFIFSRNMLIYFDKETKLKAKGILESLRKSDQHDIFFGHADLF